VEGDERVVGTSVEERIRGVVERVAQDHGLELVHVEMASVGRLPVVRIFIDKPGGVTHQDCAQVSLHAGTILDVEDFIHSPYTLEVSSPGLERGLYKREDYERFAGQLAKIKTRGTIGGQRNFRGRIVAVEGDVILFDDRTNGRVSIPLHEVAKANTEIDVDEEFRLAEQREREKKAAQKE